MTEHAPAAEKAEGHPPYLVIWVVLVGLMAVSLGFDLLSNPVLVAALVFSAAIVKAALVAWYYMHLKIEPRWVLGIVLFGLGVLGVLFIGLYLDTVAFFRSGA
jgi:cytochrome c oxidase subunit IV